MSTPTHTFTGPHPEVLADGTPVAVGAECSPDPRDLHDAAMIARGWFEEMPKPEPKRRTSSDEEKN